MKFLYDSNYIGSLYGDISEDKLVDMLSLVQPDAAFDPSKVELEPESIDEKKLKKVNELANIVVEIDNGESGVLSFQADESSRNIMAQAIDVAGRSGEKTTNWKLADNTIVEVTLLQLQAAIEAGLREHGRIVLSA